jgi:uncharacterized membrane protein YwzB
VHLAVYASVALEKKKFVKNGRFKRKAVTMIFLIIHIVHINFQNFVVDILLKK